MSKELCGFQPYQNIWGKNDNKNHKFNGNTICTTTFKGFYNALS